MDILSFKWYPNSGTCNWIYSKKINKKTVKTNKNRKKNRSLPKNKSRTKNSEIFFAWKISKYFVMRGLYKRKFQTLQCSDQSRKFHILSVHLGTLRNRYSINLFYLKYYHTSHLTNFFTVSATFIENVNE